MTCRLILESNVERQRAHRFYFRHGLTITSYHAMMTLQCSSKFEWLTYEGVQLSECATKMQERAHLRESFVQGCVAISILQRGISSPV